MHNLTSRPRHGLPELWLEEPFSVKTYHPMTTLEFGSKIVTCVFVAFVQAAGEIPN
jgi:hypothetical protein